MFRPYICNSIYSMPPNGAHSLFGRYSRVSLQAATRTVAYAKSSVETDSVKQFKDIPGPLRLPLIGTLMPYKLGIKKNEYYHEHLREMYDKYGALVREVQGPTEIIHVFDPNDINTIYKKYLVPHVAPLLQTAADYKKKNEIPPGLGNSNGEEWQYFRKAVNRFVLKPQIVNEYIPMQDQTARQAVELLGHLRLSDGSVPRMEELIDRWIKETLQRAVSGSGGRSLRTESLSSAEDTAVRLASANRKIFKISVDLKMSTGLYRYFNTPKSRQLDKYDQMFYGELTRFANDLYDKFSGEQKDNAETTDEDNSIFFRMMKDGQLAKKDLIALSTSLLSDGYSTTAPTLLGALNCLAMSPGVQGVLRAEAQKEVPEGSAVTHHTLARCTELRKFIKEVFRLYPIGDGVQRIALDDMTLSGYAIPKGTRLDLHPYVWLRDPEVFPRPEEVLLERWGKPRQWVGEGFHPILNTPFSTGTRTCVGRRLAEHDISAFLLRVLLRYSLSLPATPNGTPNTRQLYRVLLRPDGPIPLRFEPL